MNKILIPILLCILTSCKAQNFSNSRLEFTSDLKDFNHLNSFNEKLKDVDIVALGEETHGQGQVFMDKVEIVKFLHEQLGFNLILFESGYGDAALAWERFDSLSSTDFTMAFTSNFYYHSKEILELMEYVKTHDKNLKIQGFDCQPQQDYLVKRMAEIVWPIDSFISKSVFREFRNFNKLYQLENDHDTVGFYKQRDEFISFLTRYNEILNVNEQNLLKLGTTLEEINAIKKSNSIFVGTYSDIYFGSLTGWPQSANIRDKSMFETVMWFKENDPEAKIIIWAQNSHIENRSELTTNKVNWMGHSLKENFGSKYYSIGTVVYSGKYLEYNGSFDFEHNDMNYIAYHLNQYDRDEFILDLRDYPKNDFIKEPLLMMGSGGYTSKSISQQRFDGLLFIKHSDIPQLIIDK